MNTKIRIGDLLVEKGVIALEQLQMALKEQKRTGRKLGATLISLKLVTEDDILIVLSEQLKVPFIHLSHYQIKPDIVRVLPEKIARRYRALVIDLVGDQYLIGMCDPTDLLAFDEISKILKKSLRVVVVKESELMRWLNTVYRRTEEMANIATELQDKLGDTEVQEPQEEEESNQAPVMKLLESIFKDAVQVKASDIHIEPDKEVLRIRQRVDGVLTEHVMKEKRVANALVLRLKLMAKLNISEKRLPQDGRFHVKVLGKGIDVRLSTMPIQYGESVVMRILESSSGQLSIDKVGMPEKLLERLKVHITRPHGMILVTGPTGSGKTTTLYGCLTALNKATHKIITVEDPVEYSLARINQVQVNAKIGLTFASVLKAALRQDPDIVMVGEIRDQETAEIALKAAMTGHLVLSTLHTNDAISSAMRLADMGAEPYLVATAVRAIIAQRLIRRLCEDCAIPYTPDAQELSYLTAMVGPRAKQMQFKAAKGCQRCNQIGYRGRLGVYELLEIAGPMVDALRDHNASQFIKHAKASPTYKPLALVAVDYAEQGLTTIDEVFRISGELSDEDDDNKNEMEENDESVST